MSYKTIWLKRTYFGPMLVFYLIALFMFGVMQQSKLPATPIIYMQVAAVFLTFFFSFLYSKRSIAVTCVIVFFFQLIACYGLRYFNIEYFNNPLGYKPADALAYHTIASQFYYRSFHEFNMFMDEMELLLDDRGMNYINFIIYKIAGSPERGLNLSVFLNVCTITLSTFFAYKLANVFVENKYAQFVAFLWGTQLYSTYTAASGLKENYMVVFIVASLYYIAILYRDYTWKNIVLAIVFATSTLFFRMALFYMLVTSVLFVTAMRFPFLRRYIYFLIALAVIATWLSYQRTFDEIAVFRKGADAMDYDTYEGLVEAKKQQVGIFASFVSYLSAIIGPLPNIVAIGDKSNYITLYSFSSFCKCFYAFYFIVGIYYAVKEKRIEILALLVFWFLEIFMLIITFFTLHDRYHWPHVSVVIALATWGGLKWHEKKGSKLINYSYFLAAFIIIVIFNFR